MERTVGTKKKEKEKKQSTDQLCAFPANPRPFGTRPLAIASSAPGASHEFYAGSAVRSEDRGRTRVQYHFSRSLFSQLHFIHFVQCRNIMAPII